MHNDRVFLFSRFIRQQVRCLASLHQDSAQGRDYRIQNTYPKAICKHVYNKTKTFSYLGRWERNYQAPWVLILPLTAWVQNRDIKNLYINTNLLRVLYINIGLYNYDRGLVDLQTAPCILIYKYHINACVSKNNNTIYIGDENKREIINLLISADCYIQLTVIYCTIINVQFCHFLCKTNMIGLKNPV